VRVEMGRERREWDGLGIICSRILGSLWISFQTTDSSIRKEKQADLWYKLLVQK
jgi:hypothetical protein